MNVLLILPIIIPQVTGIISLLLWNKLNLQRIVSTVGTICLLIAAIVLFRSVWLGGIQATQIGGWEAPIGITVVADLFSAIMVLLAAIMAFAVNIFSLVDIDVRKKRVVQGYYPLS